MIKENETIQGWITVERPGYLGKSKDGKNFYPGTENTELMVGGWFGETAKRWRFSTTTVFSKKYIESYALYFLQHPDEASFLTENFSFAYDKELITKEEGL